MKNTYEFLIISIGSDKFYNIKKRENLLKIIVIKLNYLRLMRRQRRR